MSHPRRFRSARDAESYLLGFVNYEALRRYERSTRTHDLDLFRERLLAAGWEPGTVPAVHVGGTNAKGTVSHLLERILRAGGLRTGLYTSPHLLDIRERVRIAGAPLSRTAFRRGVERLAASFRDPELGFRTTFEHLTALALLAFQEAAADVAVIEVGLGGKLDATNVLPPGPVVFTPIALDHMHILGDTVAAIARDKSHIAKAGGRAFTMPQAPEARRVLAARCRAIGVPLEHTAQRVEVSVTGRGETGQTLHLRGAIEYGRVATGLLGAHQPANAAAAVCVAESILPRSILAAAVRRGLRGARVPGRLHVERRGRTLFVVDGGHNPAAAAAVAAALREHFPGRPVHAVIGLADDKDREGYVGALIPVIDRFTCTRANSPRAAEPAAILDAVRRRGGRGEIADGAPAALAKVVRGGAPVILVGGSFVLAGEILRELRGHR